MKNQFWLGDESSLLTYLESERKIQATPVADLQSLSIRLMAEDAAAGGEFGGYDYMVQRMENLAIVTVSGGLTTRTSPFNRLFGRVSYDEIRNAVFAAAEAPGIDAIVLNMDTPGGQASGVTEASDFLSQVDQQIKPVYTYAGTMMASGGYWLGSVGREIFASKLATIGSIGVVTVHASYEKQLKSEGIEVTVLRAGEFKALGSPYEKLDDKARAQIEGQMNTIYGVFLDTVAENRGTSVSALKKTAAEGRVFIGADAVTVGLVDHITSFDQAINQIMSKVKASSRQPFKPKTTTLTGEDMAKRKVLTDAAVAAIESGVPEADVLADPTMVREEEAEATPEANAEAAAAAAPEAQPAAPQPEGDGSQQAAPAAADNSALFGMMFDKVTSLTTEVATLRAQLATVTQERDRHKSTESALSRIAVTAINRMQVSLGQSASKLDDLDVSVVLEQYNRTYALFNQRFRVGATAQVPGDKDIHDTPAVQENGAVNAAVHRLTTARINKG